MGYGAVSGAGLRLVTRRVKPIVEFERYRGGSVKEFLIYCSMEEHHPKIGL